jgi:uncharacterized membrane protein
MASLSQAKTLGGVGSILAILFLVPYAGPVLTIAGLIMVLIAVRYVSDTAQDRAIFNDMLISTILAVVGVVAGVIVVVGTVFSALGRIFPGGIPTSPGVVPPTLTTSDLITLVAGAILGLAVIWIFLIVSAIFLRRSYRKISAFVGVGTFNTAGLLYLIGAALIILFGVGFIVIFVAEIVQIVAFFSLPDTPPTPPSGAASTSMGTTG